MEFDEREDQEEEMEEIPPLQPLPQGGYANPLGRLGGDGEDGSASTAGQQGGTVRYRECLKNHAVVIGGNAVDGCGEFIAAGEEGTLGALRCAACSCHRNFHRKEKVSISEEGGMVYHHGHPHHRQQQQFFPYYRAAPSPAGYLHLTPLQQQQHRPLALPSTPRDDLSNPSSSGGGRAAAGLMMKKRFRTKFTPEQKEMMLGFAERLGWRIQKHDEPAVEQFCSETGVKRQVLKVWMHNNRHTAGKNKP